MRKLLVFWLVIYSFVVTGAEPDGNIYWIQFQSKENTPYSLINPENYLSQRAIERRERHRIEIDSTDLPVNPVYIESLQKLGFFVKHTSRWMNGVIAVLNSQINTDSLALPTFIKSIELRKGTPPKSISVKFDEIDSASIHYYGNAYQQISIMNGEILHKQSMGEGVQIAIIDAGFKNANNISAFDHLRNRNGILGTYDFVKPENDVYNEDIHGTMVLSILASLNEGTMIGSAPKASYWLLRSEDNYSENPVEEDYWIIAAEFADSAGCEVINTSLGYSVFDNPTFNHTYDQFNGKTLRISQAANLAVDKGMVVVCSAGNSGNDAWFHIVAPSEAEKVLSVAAVDASGIVTGFSSRGFNNSNVPPKPDISAMGSGVSIVLDNGEYSSGSGTSFSSPIIAGMAACLIGLYPKKTGKEIMDLIRSCGDRYPVHSIDYGYGIPDFSKISLPDSTITKNIEFEEKESTFYPNPFSTEIFLTNTNKFKTMDIISLDGKIVFSTTFKNSNSENYSFELPYLTKGVYFAVLKGDQKLKSFKLIKN